MGGERQPAFPRERQAWVYTIDLPGGKERAEHLGPARGWLAPPEINLPEVRRAEVSFVPFVLRKKKRDEETGLRILALGIGKGITSLFGE